MKNRIDLKFSVTNSNSLSHVLWLSTATWMVVSDDHNTFTDFISSQQWVPVNSTLTNLLRFCQKSWKYQEYSTMMSASSTFTNFFNYEVFLNTSDLSQPEKKWEMTQYPIHNLDISDLTTDQQQSVSMKKRRPNCKEKRNQDHKTELRSSLNDSDDHTYVQQQNV
jgi:hypothetical protein